MNPKIETSLEEIKKQYQFQNDDELLVLLEGLANTESKGVTYWDYIEVDTLLSLQKSKTNFPDEVIFIAYHQICELYFKLIIHELEKISLPEKQGKRFLDEDVLIVWTKALTRVIRYMNKLSGSFDIMSDGLDNKQFGIFRKSLLPASGFQTYQFRLIEILLTPYINLIKENEKNLINGEFDNDFNHIYWRSGAIERDSGKPAKILINFNNKYDLLFKETISKIGENTIYDKYINFDIETKDKLKELLFELDKSILVWKLSHFAAVSKHLPAKSEKGTGGTKWGDYLPVKNQKIYYFPDIWNGVDFNSVVDSLMEKLK